MSKQKLLEFYETHKGEVVGMTIMLAFALGVIIFGFFRLVFIAICVGLGFFFGKKAYQDKNYFRNMIDRVLRFFNI